MARHRPQAQRDLFTVVQPMGRLPPETRRALVALLEALLREVLETRSPAREGSDEQDHA